MRLEINIAKRTNSLHRLLPPELGSAEGCPRARRPFCARGGARFKRYLSVGSRVFPLLPSSLARGLRPAPALPALSPWPACGPVS